MKEQFAHFKNCKSDIKTELGLKGDKTQEIIQNKNEVVARAYFIKKLFVKFVNDYIKLLLALYYNYEYINNKANKQFERNRQFEICYIVNQKYINKIKQVLNYKGFCNYKIKEKIDKYLLKSNNISNFN